MAHAVQRCFLPSLTDYHEEVILPHAESHHLSHVLRLHPGDRVLFFDGRGTRAMGKLLREEEGHLVAKIEELLNPVTRELEITLVQALPKGRKMSDIIEKATELGVARILPVTTERVVSKMSERSVRSRHERWCRIAVSAAKQCGTPWLPVINPVMPLEEAVALCSDVGLCLVGTLLNDTRRLRDVLQSVDRQKTMSIVLVIGPEGDLAPSEVELLKQNGAIAVSFGELVLRVETAAIFGLGVLAYEFGQPGSGKGP